MRMCVVVVVVVVVVVAELRGSPIDVFVSNACTYCRCIACCTCTDMIETVISGSSVTRGTSSHFCIRMVAEPSVDDSVA